MLNLCILELFAASFDEQERNEQHGDRYHGKADERPEAQPGNGNDQ